MIDSVLNFKRRLGHGLLGGSIVLGLVLSGTLIPTDTEAAFLNIVKGHVYTRGLVRGPNGQPILAAYAEDGSFVREHGEMTGEWEDANIMSAERFNALVQAFEDYKTQHADGIARGARLMSRDAYEGGPLHGQSRIRLEEDTRSVYVRGERTLYTDETEPLLFQSPLNLMLYAGGSPLDGSIKSVLVSDDGELLIRSPHHLGFWVSYTQQGEGECTDQTAVDPAEDSRLLNLYEEQRPCAPVAGAQVEAFSAVTGDTYAYTDNTGQFNLTILNPLCPGFYFEYTNIVFLKMFYSDFNPKREGMDLFFAEPRYTYAGCNGYGPHPLVPNLAPQPAVSNTRFPVDVIALTGAGRINNRGVVPGAEPLPFGETTHRTDLPVFTEQAPVDLDLDADGLPDKAILHEGTVYVYLGGRNIEFDDSGAPVNEDLTRLPDQMAEGFPDANDHEGLLSQISEEDLQQTDLYIYRVATGERIGELRGLKENEFRDGLLEDGWSYRTLLATGFNPESRKQIGWRNRAEIDDKRLEREADHLRIGEQIKLVAINRRTGYIGTQTIELKAAEGGRIDFPVPEIELRPPNLQITAERHYQVESGLTQGEERNYIIGFEGSGLTSDQYIAITTEWFDHDGTPLPNDLPGYTGRLAQVVAENTLGSSRVGHFEIKPGRRLQLVALNGTDIQNKHYYVHVAGYPSDENPDFETIGAGSGPLAHRPKYFVPIQVPIYNEKQSRAEQRAYRQQLEQYEEGLIAEKPIKPTPSYVFAYRPEMQFSVFDLTVDAINKEVNDSQIVNLLDNTDEFITGSEDTIEVLFDLLFPELPTLQAFGPGRELVFALGEEEVPVTVGEDGQVQFTHIDHLAQLSTDDFLTLSLYQNSDSANVLWEWAFASKPIGSPSDVAVSADDAQLDLLVYMPGAAGTNDDGSDQSITVHWSVTGSDGVLSETRQTSTDGIFHNTLSTSREAGSRYTVNAFVAESDSKLYPVGSEVTLGEYTVIPGEPAQIELASNNLSLPADEQSTSTIQASVFDAHENEVADGTQVGLHIDGDGDFQLEQSEVETVNGTFDLTVRSGAIVGDFNVDVVAGEAASQSMVVSTTAVDLQVDASSTTLEAGSGQAVTLTANVPGVADGTPIEWLTTAGHLGADVTVQNGQASATLRAPNEPGQGRVIVTVAGQSAMVPIEVTGTQPIVARLEHAAIAGDKITDGSVAIEQWETASRSYDYVAGTTLELQGPAGDSANLAIGTPNRPNASPVVYFPLQGVADGVSLSEDGNQQAMVMGSVAADNGALAFNGGHLLLEDDPALQINDGLFANLNFRLNSLSQIGPGDFHSLVEQSDSGDFAYRLGLIEQSGDVFVQAEVTTTDGVATLRHPAVLQANRSYKAGLRYRDGLLELQLESAEPLAVDQLQAVPVNGVLQNTQASITVGRDYRGAIANLRIGQETADNQLLAFEGGTNVTFAADGTASVSVRSNGRLGASPQQVGFTIGGASAVGHNYYQPLPIEAPGLAEEILDLFVGKAHAQAGLFSFLANRGLAMVSHESFGWFSSLGEKLASAADTAVDVVKVGAEIVSVVVGIDDFVILAKTLMSLGKDRTFLEYVEITFAAVGAIITVATVVSAGSLAPVALPLKQGLNAFKAAIKLIGPAGLKAAFGMAKGLGRLILDIIQNPSTGVQLAGDVVRALRYLAVDASQQVIQVFVAVVHAPRDFLNWIRNYKFFNRACGARVTYMDTITGEIAWAGGGSTVESLLYSVLDVFVAPAAAAGACDIVFERVLLRADTVFSGLGDAAETRRAWQEFNTLGSEFDKLLTPPDEFNVILSEDAYEGIVRMIANGRNAANARHIARSVVRDGGDALTLAQKNQIIDRYFTLIKSLEELPADTVGRRLYGDMGKLLKNSSGFNAGFIKGMYHQLEFMDELKKAGIAVESLEEGFGVIQNGKTVQRYVDITAGGRHFEVKNFARYTGKNVDNVVNGLEKELGRVVGQFADAEDAGDILNAMNEIHFVFRGPGDAQAEAMLEVMRDRGKSVLGAISDEEVLEDVLLHFDTQIDNALTVLSNNKQIPELGDLVVFQGKTVPY